MVEGAEGTYLPLLQGQPVPPLQWADDLVTAATTATGQQRQLTLLSDYSDMWWLTVNISKTEAIVLHRPNRKVHDASLRYKGLEIKQVQVFCLTRHALHCSQPFVSASIPRISGTSRISTQKPLRGP